MTWTPPLWLSGAVVGLVAAFWQQAKQWAARLLGLVYVQCHLDGYAAEAMRLYTHARMRRTPGGVRTYFGRSMWVRPAKEQRVVMYEDPVAGAGGGLFWLGWRPLHLGMSPHTIDGGKQPGFSHVVCGFIRGTFEADRLLRAAGDLHHERTRGNGKSDRFYIKRYLGSGATRRRAAASGNGSDAPASISGTSPTSVKDLVESGGVRFLQWTREQIGPEAPERSLERLALPPDAEEAAREVARWLGSRDWYRGRGIPWRRGYLLYGPPGNGKTSLVRAVAADHGLPVCVFDLASMSNDELYRYWEDMQTHTPCVALFEDLDAVFDGRENRLGDTGGGLSFDALLNCIGGIDQVDGVILFVTTNHPDRLDPAIGVPDANGEGSSRPGRVDRAILLGPPDAAGRRRIAERIVGPDCPDLTARLVTEGATDSGAQFQERCGRVALERYWADGAGREDYKDETGRWATARLDERLVTPNGTCGVVAFG